MNNDHGDLGDFFFCFCFFDQLSCEQTPTRGCDHRSLYIRWVNEIESLNSIANIRMATAYESDDEVSLSDFSDVQDSDGSDSDGSDSSASSGHDKPSKKEPCRYYNKDGCRNGDQCPNPHVCMYFLKGNCRYGDKCKLSHSKSGKTAAKSLTSGDSKPEPAEKLKDGRPYQWQLSDGSKWTDIHNDHVIEAQYSLPHTKSMTIYNTKYGSVTIDFNRMRVLVKTNLKVRRLDDGKTFWNWYCTLNSKWKKYGDKDSKGKGTPVNSSDIEKAYRENPTGTFHYNMGSHNYKIHFKEMRQEGKNKKRKVTRRPRFQSKHGGGGGGVGHITTGVGTISTGGPQWQFEGSGGSWHDFKSKASNDCSVSNGDIERKYQQDRRGKMNFTVKGQNYELNFGAMTQTNLQTRKSRKIKRN